jgi:EAL domain-containing protein (putative c-di-GMP-specific phosphodiesterase class I)
VIIPPSDFIPVAEEMGIIVDIGAWVLREACLRCAAWPPDVRVAVNLSSIQFRRGDIFDTIAGALAYAKLPADRLEIEITESLLLQDFPATRTTLERLRRHGVRIALDDFGTGYSGLSYLHSFPLDKVKIDRAFLSGLDADSRSRTLLRGVAQLSAMLGLTVTVEGVETEEQLSVITAETSVHEAQGYLFGAAMPDREIFELLRAASSRTTTEVDKDWLATARSAS